MALINDVYVLAEEESVDNQVETVSHPTESGMPTSDTVRRQPISLQLTGKIVNTPKLSTKVAIEKLKITQKNGNLVTYVGQLGTLKNLQIQTFNTNFNNKNYGGADFSMTLKEIKTAKNSYVAPKKVQEKKKTISEGDTVLFHGGYVYVSSDAKKHSSNRGESECELTIISKLHNATHIYHLISKDGGGVYGWVDASKVSLIEPATQGDKSGGTQLLKGGNKTTLYHTVKKGETIWGLVNKTYRGYGFTEKGVISDNPSAFSRRNDPKTLKIGARLKLNKVSAVYKD